MSQSLYGIDLAKHSFSIHGEDPTGKVLIHKTITRSKVLSTFANIPPAIIGMEACGASHYWAMKKNDSNTFKPSLCWRGC